MIGPFRLALPLFSQNPKGVVSSSKTPSNLQKKKSFDFILRNFLELHFYRDKPEIHRAT